MPCSNLALSKIAVTNLYLHAIAHCPLGCKEHGLTLPCVLQLQLTAHLAPPCKLMQQHLLISMMSITGTMILATWTVTAGLVFYNVIQAAETHTPFHSMPQHTVIKH